MRAFHEMPVTEGKAQQFKVSITKEQLKEAADFRTLSNPPTTTGAALATPPPGPALTPRPTPTAPPADK